jgi:hypothetical protein
MSEPNLKITSETMPSRNSWRNFYIPFLEEKIGEKVRKLW